MTDPDRLAHAKVGSWFLGPRAENFQILSDFFTAILNDQRLARQNVYSKDPAFITDEMMQTSSYKESVKTLATNSPRYNGHMNMDTALPNMATMMYNPNNVATEASPLSTRYEREVGLQLCHMLGYGSGGVTPWGHITCDGSVANLEAIWAIRNLKFYPLSLKLAMAEGAPLNFLAHATPTFYVGTCKGEKKPFTELSTWELLNLTPSTVLELPTRLGEEYSTLGKDCLEKTFGIKPGKFFVSATKHYSWPKGGAISGIGSVNFVDVAVDEDARMSIDALRTRLNECIEGDSESNYSPVFGTVAIIGSTEHGACDPVKEIAALRDEFQKKGLSFAIHCDAAWGGYFASTIQRDREAPGDFLPFVPALALQPYTTEQLHHLHHAESITIDPHKSGYINYPAGGLCYRDERMRYLVTWTSPIVFHEAAGDAVESMGVYGVEGSKPGAAAVAAWLSHKTLGLHKLGYGRLLGEAVFTCTKLYCHWATMTRPEDDLIVVPLIRLPSEKKGGSEQDVEEKQRIREKILGVSNEELANDKDTWLFLATLGGDLMINAFGCNFKINGKPNTDVGEANYLNQRIFQRLSVTSEKDVVRERPLFLTSSMFSEDAYGKCLATYKKRLQLDDGKTPAHGDLRFLVNVTMSPWPTDSPFLQELALSFREIAEEEVRRVMERNTIKPTFHGFVMQGYDKICLVHMPMFNMANHRWQLIVTADYPTEVQQLYQKLRTENPGKLYTTANANPETLADMLSPGAEIEYRMDDGIPGPDIPPLATFKLSNIRVLVNESMSYAALDTKYPDKMPFYLYGSLRETHIDHVLKTSPNAQLTADRVEVNVEPELSEEQLAKGGLVAVLEDVFEKSVQPLPLDSDGNVKLDAHGLALVPGAKHKVSVYASYEDFKSGSCKPIATGSITIGKGGMFADWKDVNMDPADEPEAVSVQEATFAHWFRG
ncbi:L-tyrosine decarboxylase [Diplogelasinospora grovesii]|uniref:L-tyrosine decarboxylase n=1 Tax=Diplogelasinospora grovesii TaxID=303347 RepID=A0AAN6N0I6_9PEZI|nr:L-tyrosine decarboxylase [Diplogelasinospora grovesii]